MLTFTLEYLEKERVVLARTAGTMDLPDLMRFSQTAFEYGTKLGISHYLVDHRNMVPKISTFELYELPTLLQKSGLAGDIKIAIVFRENSEKKEDFDFYQMRSWSMGINNLRQFTDEQQAMSWLLR